MKNIFWCGLFFLLSSPAFAERFPHATVKIDGVPHKLILRGFLEYGEYRDALESGDGFCVAAGYRVSVASTSTLADTGPYVLLDSAGFVIKTFSNLPENSNRFWIAESLECE